MSPQAGNSAQAAQDLAHRIAPVLRRYGVVRAGLFGSVARGEAGPASDIDLLVEYHPGRRLRLRELVELHDEVERVAGRKAQVIEYRLLRERIRERVLAEQVPVL